MKTIYEERYNKALESAKRELESCGTLDCDAAKQIFRIFPELAENEDERIRKDCIKYLDWEYKHCSFDEDKMKIEKCVSWLEKQGGQIDFAPKAEPKFKVGDWVRAISSGNIFKILSVNDGLYRVLCYDGVEANYPIEVEKDLEYWTINDAKDGDVLKENSCSFIIERMKPDGTAVIHCCLFDGGVFGLGSTLSFVVDSTYPATKEQRDFLFQKMHEAGYEWDAENKQVRKNSSINF